MNNKKHIRVFLLILLAWGLLIFGEIPKETVDYEETKEMIRNTYDFEADQMNLHYKEEVYHWFYRRPTHCHHFSGIFVFENENYFVNIYLAEKETDRKIYHPEKYLVIESEMIDFDNTKVRIDLCDELYFDSDTEDDLYAVYVKAYSSYKGDYVWIEAFKPGEREVVTKLDKALYIKLIESILQQGFTN